MTDTRVWFVTGAGRGMGVNIAQAALGAGHAVVATGRDPEAVTNAVCPQRVRRSRSRARPIRSATSRR